MSEATGGQPMIDPDLIGRAYDAADPFCEYCNRNTSNDGLTITYAWHADEWCTDCMLDLGRFNRGPNGPLTQADIDAAPLGRPDPATYEQPFVLTTADGRVRDGEVVA